MQYSRKTFVRVAGPRLLSGFLILLVGLLGLQQSARTAHAASVPPSFDLVLFTNADTVWGHNGFPGTELDNDDIGVTNNSSLNSSSFGTLLAVFARGTDIYEQRDNTANMFLLQLTWSPGGCVTATGWCLVELDDNPSTLTGVAGGNGQFYQTHVNGTIWQLNGICFHCWTQISNPNMGDQITAGDGKLFASNGQTAWKYAGTPFSWTTIDQTPTQNIAVSPTGVLYEIRATTIAQGLSAFHWVTIYTNTSNENTGLIEAGERTYQDTETNSGGIGNILIYNGNFNSPSWSLLPPLPATADQGGQPGTTSDALYVVLDNGSVWQYTPESGIWQEFSPPVAPQFVELASPGNCLC